MPGYATRLLTLRFGGQDYRIRALSDLQQFADPHGRAERAGISSAMWSLFGQVWPAGRVLAQAMSQFDVAGKRVLELGCGLGLASLVLQRRQCDVTASDHHPLAEEHLGAVAPAVGALALDAQSALRPDLKIVVMSATLDVAGVLARIGFADITRSSPTPGPRWCLWRWARRRGAAMAMPI